MNLFLILSLGFDDFDIFSRSSGKAATYGFFNGTKNVNNRSSTSGAGGRWGNRWVGQGEGSREDGLKKKKKGGNPRLGLYINHFDSSFQIFPSPFCGAGRETICLYHS